MPKIVFIRHAESEYNRDGIWEGRVDCSLTEKGIESAKKLGNTIENNFDAIYCSPLKRAKQTLEAIFPNAKPIYDERIIEISIVEWEDKKKDLFDTHLRELFRKGLYTPPGAESHQDVDKRACNFVEELFEKYKNNERILVVTHNGIIRSIKRNFLEPAPNLMSTNLGMISLNDSDYEYYIGKRDLEER